MIKFRGDIILKKRIMISLLAGLIICSIAAYSFGTTGIVNTETLRLRKSNSTDSSILRLISIDEKVEILTRTEDGWYKVKYTDYQGNEYEGYVSEDYITVKENEDVQTSNPSEEIETSEEVNNEETQPQEEVGTEENTTKIIKKGEKIYKTPLINTNTTSILEKDLTVEVLTELNGWSYVTSEEFEGWVRTDKLIDSNAEEKIGYISGSSVNFREQPNTSGTVISKLSRNKKVVILEKNNGWVKIEVDGKQGYVIADYISDTKVATTSRSSSRRTESTNTNTNTSTNTTQNETTSTEKIEDVANASTSEIVAYAKKYLGYKYVYGGTTPSGFDCSGFVQYVYKHFGYSINRTARAQTKNGVSVSKGNLQQGDLIFFSGSSGSSTITHVGLYIGGGKFIHAANARKGVIISNVDGDGFYYVCARRIVN